MFIAEIHLTLHSKEEVEWLGWAGLGESKFFKSHSVLLFHLILILIVRCAYSVLPGSKNFVIRNTVRRLDIFSHLSVLFLIGR